MVFLRNFPLGNGVIYLPDILLSFRLVKDALGEKFDIRLIEEAPDYIRGKVISKGQKM